MKLRLWVVWVLSFLYGAFLALFVIVLENDSFFWVGFLVGFCIPAALVWFSRERGVS